MFASDPGWEKGEFSQILYSPVTTHNSAYISFWISPWLWLMRVSKFPDSKMMPRRIKRILLQPVKNEMLFVTRTLALVPSNPAGPMTWSVWSLLIYFNKNRSWLTVNMTCNVSINSSEHIVQQYQIRASINSTGKGNASSLTTAQLFHKSIIFGWH